MPTPTPIPALAPVERPLLPEPDDDSLEVDGLSLDVALATGMQLFEAFGNLSEEQTFFVFSTSTVPVAVGGMDTL